MCTYDLQSVLEAIDVLVDDWQLAVTAKMAGRISASVSSNRAKSTTTPKAEFQKKKQRSSRVSILAYEAPEELALWLCFVSIVGCGFKISGETFLVRFLQT